MTLANWPGFIPLLRRVVDRNSDDKPLIHKTGLSQICISESAYDLRDAGLIVVSAIRTRMSDEANSHDRF
jgi:hypothetical protein